MKRNKSADLRKAKQLCSQIHRALEYCINEDIPTELAVTVVDVAPAPNTSHLLVTVEPLEQVSVEDYPAILESLGAEYGKLRTEVAQSIHRKKTPTLSFSIQPKGYYFTDNR